MKTVFILTLLIFSFLVFGDPLTKVVESVNRGNIESVQSFLKLETSPCVEGVLEQIKGGEWEFAPCLTEKEKAFLLEVALRKNKESFYTSFLKAGFDVNSRDKDGLTLLHWASFREHTQLAFLLVDKGADLNIQSKTGLTPLHWASRGNTELALFLMDRGADLNVQDENGETPLHWAVSSEGDKGLKYLLFVMNNNLFVGDRPLARKKIAFTLIDKGADLDIQNSLGETPLHKASYNLGQKG